MMELATPEQALVGVKTINEVQLHELGWNSGKNRPYVSFSHRGFLKHFFKFVVKSIVYAEKP